MKNLVYFLFSLVLVLLGVGGCSSLSYKNYLEQQYGGVSEAELRSGWGMPDKEYTDSGVRYLVYTKTEQRNIIVQPAIYEPYFDGKNVHHRIVQPERWALRDVSCTTIFTLQDSIVIASRYEGSCVVP